MPKRPAIQLSGIVVAARNSLAKDNSAQGRQPHFPIALIGVNRPPLVSPRHDMV
jgi:hypothetical protein